MVAARHPLSGGHEEATANADLLFVQQRRKRLRGLRYRLMSFVQNTKIEAYARFASRRGEIRADVIGRKYDLGCSLGASAQECCDLIDVCVCGDAQVVNLANELILL